MRMSRSCAVPDMQLSIWLALILVGAIALLLSKVICGVLLLLVAHLLPMRMGESVHDRGG